MSLLPLRDSQRPTYEKQHLVADGHQQGDSPRAENKMMSAERCAQIIVNGVVKRKREIVMTLVEGK